MYHHHRDGSEVTLEIEDVDPEAIFAEALLGLSSVLSDARPPDPAHGGTPVTHAIHVSASDLPALLGEWMRELVRLAEDDGFLPERLEKLRLEGSSARAVVAGERSLPSGLIKAIHYERLEMERLEDGAWSARVILDAHDE